MPKPTAKPVRTNSSERQRLTDEYFRLVEALECIRRRLRELDSEATLYDFAFRENELR